jgi:hypothetical protein
VRRPKELSIVTVVHGPRLKTIRTLKQKWRPAGRDRRQALGRITSES